MNQSRPSLEPILEAHIRTLALAWRPGTVERDRSPARRFRALLRSTFPQLRRLAPLRRDPHLLSRLRSLCEEQPPRSNRTRLLPLRPLRRLREDLAANRHSLLPDLLRPEDFPPQPRYLPRPLSLQEDQLVQPALRRTEDLAANALLLIRAPGIGIGECIPLPLDCLRQLAPNRWALHVPLGKLHTGRLVPVDPELRHTLERMLALRALAPASHLAKSQGLRLPRGSHLALRDTRRAALAQLPQLRK